MYLNCAWRFDGGVSLYYFNTSSLHVPPNFRNKKRRRIDKQYIVFEIHKLQNINHFLSKVIIHILEMLHVLITNLYFYYTILLRTSFQLLKRFGININYRTIIYESICKYFIKSLDRISHFS